jgi:hypothetical protein
VDPAFTAPPLQVLSNDELVVAICQLQCRDRPQMLRLAAQLVSREVVDSRALCLVARRERAGSILAELARQALRVAPEHDTWLAVLAAFEGHPRPREPLMHWTRLAQPVMKNGRCNAESWQLVR